MMQASARRARTIITDSVFSKNEIVRWLGMDPQKVKVIYPAVDTTFRRVDEPRVRDSICSKHGIAGDYIFYTGIYKPRKNHAGLLRAFQHFLSAGGDGQLVIAGPLEQGARHLRSLAEELGINEKMVLTGFIEDSELRALYSAARVYACPSLYEGFGFTVLEAMACGTPVVCSQAASLPEVGGDAALYADATNAQPFGEALFRAFTDENLREEMIQSGYENVRRFSWEDAASNCLEIYDKVVGSSVDRQVACA
jgi:glycosyltransferase involved in cell wall biosynthesis